MFKLLVPDQMKHSTEGIEILVVNLAFQRGSLTVLIYSRTQSGLKPKYRIKTIKYPVKI